MANAPSRARQGRAMTLDDLPFDAPDSRPTRNGARGRPKCKRHGQRRDPVTHETYYQVRVRDGYGCLGRAVGMPGTCEGWIELDHIRNGGLSLRGPSTTANLASLCRAHHRMKTEASRTWRPLLVAEVARREAQ